LRFGLGVVLHAWPLHEPEELGSPGVNRVTRPGGRVKRKQGKKVKLSIPPTAAKTVSLENPPRKRRFISGGPEQPQYFPESGCALQESRARDRLVAEAGGTSHEVLLDVSRRRGGLGCLRRYRPDTSSRSDPGVANRCASRGSGTGATAVVAR